MRSIFFLNNSNTRNKLCKSKSNRSCCIFPKSSKLNSIESKIPSFRILLNQKAHHFQAGYSPGSLDKVPRQAPPKVCPRYPENESQKVQLPVFDKIDVNIWRKKTVVSLIWNRSWILTWLVECKNSYVGFQTWEIPLKFPKQSLPVWFRLPRSISCL